MIYHGDCLEVLRTLPDCSVDAVVTDPPYGLSFMGKKWDYDVPSEEVWRECLRVLKPGGHLLAFAGTRTQHRMAVRIEDAGFEIRDMIAWVYGSGFPKSLDVSKAIDKAAGARIHDAKGFNVAGIGQSNGGSRFRSDHPDYVRPQGITDAARQWQGWGTALKPALEPITVARKPLTGTVAENVMAHGTGAINVDGCRVDGKKRSPGFTSTLGIVERSNSLSGAKTPRENVDETQGRWPANLIHDGSEEVVGLFPMTAPSKAAARGELADIRSNKFNSASETIAGSNAIRGYNDNGGSAARFFYCAKAAKKDRGDGNNHPTVKPTDLMRYLCRLVTPPGGTVLDPFMGSGSTGKAAILEGFNFIGIEREAEYVEIAKARIAAVRAQPKQEDLF